MRCEEKGNKFSSAASVEAESKLSKATILPLKPEGKRCSLHAHPRNQGSQARCRTIPLSGNWLFNARTLTCNCKTILGETSQHFYPICAKKCYICIGCRPTTRLQASVETLNIPSPHRYGRASWQLRNISERPNNAEMFLAH